ncbi:XdhC family protein [Flammeovirga kamogawensis]|uniref:XdhC family protein n=1 Tax=Flammeovirga kamogawensis TaxID=373891 RepID=A0ABX8GT51_9BACT|nr:XdhC/CoxI family protein [Flammeovirga kamogawensis]MBB6463888.1 xanthine/CO dehydrogenase XdhC/CoxF family maturation factor [Flammeovirga kamogawensis]QWG06588.1 XdhC family protein [Flammeovirga kamogawensis]TRX68414.1 XdhC family protein [Flammeovirga kamogawensis]
MLHELKNIIHTVYKAKQHKIKAVLVTVVGLDGSSYRKPGVRMLILENDEMIGAVSGGCVEKEILKQSQRVFKTGKALLINYDGRYRLGCEGILTILIEPFDISENFYSNFNNAVKQRDVITIESHYSLTDRNGISIFSFDKKKQENSAYTKVFKEELKPEFHLYILGVEHDAVVLCKYAVMTGWKVTIVAAPLNTNVIEDFPGASNLMKIEAEEVGHLKMDKHSGVMIMTHSFVKDLKYLLTITQQPIAYLGLLGANKRTEKLKEQLFDYQPDLDFEFIEKINGPAGLNIGAITPEEIAISIVAEVLAILRNKSVQLTNTVSIYG